MSIYAIVTSITAGYDSDRKQIEKLHFKLGDKFEVKRIEIGQSFSKVYLKDFPNQNFNSVFFKFEEDNKSLDIFSDDRFNMYLNMFKKRN